MFSYNRLLTIIMKPEKLTNLFVDIMIKKILVVSILVTIVLNLTSCAPPPLQLQINSAFPIYPTTSLGLFDISSFDVYSDSQRLHAVVSGKKSSEDTQGVVYYLQSTDEGRHWSPPVNLNINGFSKVLTGRGSDAQIAAHDQNLVAIWQSMGELPGTGPLVSVYSTDGGKTWKTGPNPAVDNSGDQAHPDLLVDHQGYFHVVWLADPEENGYQSLRYARSSTNGLSWQIPVTLDQTTCSCCWNTLAESPNHQIHVLYRDMKPRDMTLLSSSDNGLTWQEKKTLGEFNWQFDGCPHVGGGLAVDAHAFYASVWTGAASHSGLYTVTSKKPLPIKIGKNATHSDIAVLNDKQDHLVLVWDEMNPEGTGIFSAESLDAGITWSTAKRLSAMGTHATHPHVIATASGFLVLWTEKQEKQTTSRWAILHQP